MENQVNTAKIPINDPNYLSGIAFALKNSLSENNELRQKAYDLLSSLESNPDFGQSLISIITSSNEEDLQYKCLIYLKNTMFTGTTLHFKSTD